MKKWLAVLLVLVLCFSMAACSSSEDKEGEKKPTTSYEEGVDSAAPGMIETVTELYGTLVNTLAGKEEKTQHAEISVHVGKEAMTLLSQLTGGDTSSLDWINDVKVSLDAAQEGYLSEATMKLMLDNTNILSASVISDTASGKLFYALPELNDKYLALQVESNDFVTGQTLITDNLAEILPDAETFGTLLERYIDTVIDSVALPNKESVELKAGGVTKTVSQQKVVINQKLIATVCTATLNKLKSDADIKAIVDNLQKIAEEKYGFTDQDFHGEFVKALDEVLAEINATPTLSEEEIATVTVYTDGDELVGLAVSGDGVESFYCLALTKDGKTGVDIQYGAIVSQFGIMGSSTKKNGKVNGTYEILVDANPILTMELKDVVTKGETSSGTLYIWPEEGLGGDASSAATMMNLGLKVTFNNKKDSTETTLDVMGGDVVYGGITVKTSVKNTATVTLPSDDKVVDMQNTAELEAWIQSLDTSKIFDRLGDAGMSDLWIDALEALLSSGFGGDNLYGDYVDFGGDYEDYFGDVESSYGEYFGDLEGIYGEYADELEGFEDYDEFIEYFSDPDNAAEFEEFLKEFYGEDLEETLDEYLYGMYDTEDFEGFEGYLGDLEGILDQL